ncbi:MAG: 5'-3' exonuclease [Pseudomonadales bacterium]
MSRTNILVIDGNWYAHRAFYTIDIERPEPEKALAYRFLSMICKDAIETRAKHLLVAFDGPKVFRYKLYPEYKSSRTSKDKATGKKIEPGEQSDDPLARMMPYLLEYLTEAGIPWVRPKKFEGDDVLAAIAHYFKDDEDYLVYLGIQDKDLYQSLAKNVRLFMSNTKPEPTRFTWKDAEKAKGVKIKQMIDYQTVLGDSIDDIPGIPGYGPVTVAAKLREHGSLKKWMKAAKGDERKKLLIHRDQLELNAKLVTMRTDSYEPDLAMMTVPKKKPVHLPRSHAAYVDWLYPKTKGLF